MAYCPPIIPIKIPTVSKLPSAVLNYGFDLSPEAEPSNDPWTPPGVTLVPWLAPGEEVIELTVTSDGGTPTGTTDVTILTTTITANPEGVPGSLLTGWIGGGVVGTTYLITFSWLTNSTPIGRQDSRTLRLVCVAIL